MLFTGQEIWMGRNCARTLENEPSPPGASRIGKKLDRSSANQITGFSGKPDREKIKSNNFTITYILSSSGSVIERFVKRMSTTEIYGF